MACIWETAESHANGFRSGRSLLQNGTPMDSAGMEDLLWFLGECICMSYVCHMTDIPFLTESMTGVDRCGKEIVGINLPKDCLGTEFNLLTVLRGGAGHGLSERSDGNESPGTISHTQQASFVGGPPAGGPRRRAGPRVGGPRADGPRAGGVSQRAGARTCGVPTRGLGQRRSTRARLWQINLVVLDDCCAVVCRTRTAMQLPA